MAPTNAETILLSIRTEATGTQDLERIKGLMNQLGSELRGVGQVSDQEHRSKQPRPLRVNGKRCVVVGPDLVCTLGELPVGSKRTLYATGVSKVQAQVGRADGSMDTLKAQ